MSSLCIKKEFFFKSSDLLLYVMHVGFTIGTSKDICKYVNVKNICIIDIYKMCMFA